MKINYLVRRKTSTLSEFGDQATVQEYKDQSVLQEYRDQHDSSDNDQSLKFLTSLNKQTHLIREAEEHIKAQVNTSQDLQNKANKLFKKNRFVN